MPIIQFISLSFSAFRVGIKVKEKIPKILGGHLRITTIKLSKDKVLQQESNNFCSIFFQRLWVWLWHVYCALKFLNEAHKINKINCDKYFTQWRSSICHNTSEWPHPARRKFPHSVKFVYLNYFFLNFFMLNLFCLFFLFASKPFKSNKTGQNLLQGLLKRKKREIIYGFRREISSAQ